MDFLYVFSDSAKLNVLFQKIVLRNIIVSAYHGGFKIMDLNPFRY